MADHPTLSSEEPEQWRAVHGFEGLYEVSDLGRVRSLPHPTATGVRGGRVLKPWMTTTGYPAVTLSKEDVNFRRTVHSLVAEAFIGPRPEGEQTRHGPRGSLDAARDNLCYGTRSQNEQDKIRDGTSNHGERNGQAKLAEDDVDRIRARYAAGESRTSIARDFEISPSYVGDLARGLRWSRPAVTRITTGHARGERQHNAKLTAEIVLECRARRAAGQTYPALAREFGVTKAVVREAVIGKTWKHVA